MEVSLCISSQPPDMTENCPLGCIPGSGFRVWGESTNTSSLRPMGLLFWLWEEDWKKEDMRGGHSSPMRMWSQWEISPRSCVRFWAVRVPTSPSSSKQTWGCDQEDKGSQWRVPGDGQGWVEKLTGASLYTARDGSGTVAGLNQGPWGGIHSNTGWKVQVSSHTDSCRI